MGVGGVAHCVATACRGGTTLDGSGGNGHKGGAFTGRWARYWLGYTARRDALRSHLGRYCVTGRCLGGLRPRSTGSLRMRGCSGCWRSGYRLGDGPLVRIDGKGQNRQGEGCNFAHAAPLACHLCMSLQAVPVRTKFIASLGGASAAGESGGDCVAMGVERVETGMADQHEQYPTLQRRMAITWPAAAAPTAVPVGAGRSMPGWNVPALGRPGRMRGPD